MMINDDVCGFHPVLYATFIKISKYCSKYRSKYRSKYTTNILVMCSTRSQLSLPVKYYRPRCYSGLQYLDGPEWMWQGSINTAELYVMYRYKNFNWLDVLALDLHLICSDKNDHCEICLPDLPTCVQYWGVAV